MSAFSKAYQCLKTILAYLLLLISISHNNHIVSLGGIKKKHTLCLLLKMVTI